MAKVNRWWIVKPVVLVACLLPTAWTIRVLWLAYQGLDPGVFGDPIKVVREVTGIWTLRYLMITLAITPLRRLTGWNSLIRIRRMIGLLAFFQGVVHFAIYLWLDESFIVGEIVKDIIRRPFIASGVISLFLMLPLAVTSTKKWIGRLGGKRWQLVHRLIYFAALAGVIHYYFYVKSDIRDPLAYAVLLMILLGFRGWRAIRERGLKAATTVGAQM
jgi:methionine sulfoxide reductase heme-binding subunit